MRRKSTTAAAETIEKVFQRWNVFGLIGEILDSLWWGFQPFEIMWERHGDYVLPAKMIGKPPKWFVFAEKSGLLLQTKAIPKGHALPPYKFVVAQHNPKFENPYGDRVASRCFWYHRFKKNGVKWWVVFAEKYGSPWIVGKTPRGAQEKEQQDLLTMLHNMVKDAIGVVPDDSSVDVLSIKQTGSISVYDRLTAYCDAQISKAILGHSAGADSSPGKLGGDDLAMQVRRDLVADDSHLVECVFNQVIDWVIEINFGPEACRPAFEFQRKAKVRTAQAKRDKILADLGLKFQPQYLQKTYGLITGRDII